MTDNVVKIVPLAPYVQDEYHADGSREHGHAWLCIDKRYFLEAANHDGNFINIPLDDARAGLLLKGLSDYFFKRVI